MRARIVTVGLLLAVFARAGAGPAFPDPEALEQVVGTFAPQGADAASSWAVSLLLEGEHERARALLGDATKAIHDSEGPFSTDLILPYALLGEAEAAAGRLREADEALTRSQHLTHRAWGGTNAAQLPLVYRRADVNTALGEHQEADQLGELAMRIGRENHGAASSAFVDAAVRQGRRLRERGDYKASLSLLRRAVNDVAAERSDDDPLLVPLLRARAESFLGGPLAGRSLWMTRRALEIMDANPDTFPAAERVIARVEYGDLLMVFSYERAAVGEYEHAWRLAADSNEEALRRALESPVLVRYRTFLPAERALTVLERVSFQLDITDDGRPRNVRVVDSTASNVVDYYAPRIVRAEVRYRPAIVDGRAIATASHQEPLVLGTREPGMPRVRQLFRSREPVGASASASF